MSRRADADALEERHLVEAQLGREPRHPWRVASRCGFGYPVVLAVGPILDDGTPFPTFYWLSCPWLVDLVSRKESTGAVSEWAKQLATDPEMATRMRAAEAAYCEARSGTASPDGTPDIGGFAGQRDVLATKCLHAHVAARVAGIDDPVGEGVLADVELECSDERCAVLATAAGEDSHG